MIVLFTHLIYVFIYLVKSVNWLATYLEIADHSADDIFFAFVPNCQFNFFPPRILEWGFRSDCVIFQALLSFILYMYALFLF